MPVAIHSQNIMKWNSSIGKSVWWKKRANSNKAKRVLCGIHMRWEWLRWDELSKLEFLIKFHQFDNRRKFIVVVANNVKCRCRCRHRHCRHRRHSCRWKTMFKIPLCVPPHRPLPTRTKNSHRKCIAKRHDECKSVEFVFYSQHHQFCQLS